MLLVIVVAAKVGSAKPAPMGARVLKGTSPFAGRLAHFGQLQLAPKVGRHRLKSNLLCVTGHRGGETFSALDLAAQVAGVGHLLLLRGSIPHHAQSGSLWLMTLVKTGQYVDGTRSASLIPLASGAK
jgi:hypothetical protein